MRTEQYQHTLPPSDAYRDIDAEVALVANGALVDAEDTVRAVRLTRTQAGPDRIAIDVDLDLGLAGQAVTVSVDRMTLVRALLSLSPLTRPVVGERLVDLTSHETVTVRVVDGMQCEVAGPGGLYRQHAGLLAKWATVTEDA